MRLFDPRSQYEGKRDTTSYSDKDSPRLTMQRQLQGDMMERKK